MYDELKRGYLNTEASCAANGITFLPFIVEADGGGLGRTARQVCAHIAKGAASRVNTEVEVQACELLRRISMTLQRENARSVLKRMPLPNVESATLDPAIWAEDGMAWQ